jgi:hypothetical protein
MRGTRERTATWGWQRRIRPAVAAAFWRRGRCALASPLVGSGVAEPPAPSSRSRRGPCGEGAAEGRLVGGRVVVSTDVCHGRWGRCVTLWEARSSFWRRRPTARLHPGASLASSSLRAVYLQPCAGAIRPRAPERRGTRRAGRPGVREGVSLPAVVYAAKPRGVTKERPAPWARTESTAVPGGGEVRVPHYLPISQTHSPSALLDGRPELAYREALLGQWNRGAGSRVSLWTAAPSTPPSSVAAARCAARALAGAWHDARCCCLTELPRRALRTVPRLPQRSPVEQRERDGDDEE